MESPISPAKPTCRVGIDLDGVVIDHTRAFLDASREAGFSLEPWQVNSNVFKNYLPSRECNEVKHIVYTLRREHAPCMPRFSEILERLRRIELSIASVQKEPEAEVKTRRWLDREGVHRLVPESRTHLVRTKEEKISLIKGLGLDYFIDDGLDILEPLRGHLVPILFDPVGIRDRVAIPDVIEVASGWPDVARLLGSMDTSSAA